MPTRRYKRSQAHRRQTYPFNPEFWDRLSRIPLSKNALRELDRRNTLQSLVPNQHLENRLPHEADINRFSRLGGPDLRDLRGVRRALFLRQKQFFSAF